MTLSFKKLFKKEETKVDNTVAEQAPVAKENANSDAENQDTIQKKGKHGEPGVCCGSCS